MLVEKQQKGHWWWLLSLGWSPRPLFLDISLLITPFKTAQEPLPPYHTLIGNGFHLLFAKSGLIDPNYEKQKAKPWKNGTVVDPFEGGYSACNNPHLLNIPLLPPKNGFQQHCARYLHLRWPTLFLQWLWDVKFEIKPCKATGLWHTIIMILIQVWLAPKCMLFPLFTITSKMERQTGLFHLT